MIHLHVERGVYFTKERILPWMLLSCAAFNVVELASGFILFRNVANCLFGHCYRFPISLMELVYSFLGVFSPNDGHHYLY